MFALETGHERSRTLFVGVDVHKDSIAIALVAVAWELAGFV